MFFSLLIFIYFRLQRLRTFAAAPTEETLLQQEFRILQTTNPQTETIPFKIAYAARIARALVQKPASS